MAKIMNQSFLNFEHEYNPKDNDGKLSKEEFCFENCTFEDCTLTFNSSYVRFSNCRFKGCIIIHNKGIGNDDTLNLVDIVPDSDLVSMTLSSPDILLENVNIFAQDKSIISGYEVEIEETNILGHSSIEFCYGLSLEDSNLFDTHISCYQDGWEELEEDAVEIGESVNINGQQICSEEELRTLFQSNNSSHKNR